MDAIGIGSLNLDMIFEIEGSELVELDIEPGAEKYGTSEEFSVLLDILRSRGRLVGQAGGGSAANVICALGKMGFKTGILGMVGKDEYGDFILESMGKVDVERVGRENRTGMCISIIIDNDRSLLVLPNANDLFTTAPCDLEYLRNSKVVHLTSFVGKRSMMAQVRITRDLQSEVIVSLDPGELYAHRGIEVMKPLIERADIMFPSGTEVRILTGMDPVRGSKKLMRMGPDIVVCTMGRKGAAIVTAEGTIRIPSEKVKPVDKTGAGDVFAASFIAGMLRKWDLEECGRFAAMASARSIAEYGRDGYPDLELLKSFEGGRTDA